MAGPWTLIVLAQLSIVCFGCRATREAIDTGGEKSREVIGGIDPTGVVAASSEQRRTLAAIRAQVEAIDVDGFNRAVERLSAVTDAMALRLDALSPQELSTASHELANALAALSTQLEDAPLGETVKSVHALARTAEQSISSLNVENVQAVLDDTRATLSDLAAAVDKLQAGLQDTMRDTQNLIDEGRAKVRALPTTELRDALNTLDLAVRDVRGVTTDLSATVPLLQTALTSGRLAFLSFAGLCVVGMICGGVWVFRRALRRSS